MPAMKLTDPGPTRTKQVGFIEGSFRDTADRDYIATRLLHRHHLWEQFLWMSLQAIEKYLKAIILYHDGDTRKLGHDIEKALEQAESIGPLTMQISSRAKDFIKYLNGQGENRYFTYPRYTEGKGLLHLDHTVWQIRRYCDDFFFPHESPMLLALQRNRLTFVRFDAEKKMAEFRLDERGFLEKVLDGGKHPELRRALVWHNFCFAKRNRKAICMSLGTYWTQPSNFIFPDILDWARERVKLPKVVIAEMERNNIERVTSATPSRPTRTTVDNS